MVSGFNGVATEIKHKHDPFFEKVDVRANCKKVRVRRASSVVAVEKDPSLMAHAQWLYHVAALRLLANYLDSTRHGAPARMGIAELKRYHSTVATATSPLRLSVYERVNCWEITYESFGRSKPSQAKRRIPLSKK